MKSDIFFSKLEVFSHFLSFSEVSRLIVFIFLGKSLDIHINSNKLVHSLFGLDIDGFFWLLDVIIYFWLTLNSEMASIFGYLTAFIHVGFDYWCIFLGDCFSRSIHINFSLLTSCGSIHFIASLRRWGRSGSRSRLNGVGDGLNNVGWFVDCFLLRFGFGCGRLGLLWFLGSSPPPWGTSSSEKHSIKVLFSWPFLSSSIEAYVRVNIPPYSYFSFPSISSSIWSPFLSPPPCIIS